MNIELPPIFSPVVSMVPDVMGEPEDINVHQAISSIRSDRYKAAVIRIRREYLRHVDPKEAKRAVDPLKKKLPAIMWSGRFKARGDDNLLEYSGLLCADLDNLPGADLTNVWQGLRSDRHVWCAFQSPTGSGLKVVYRVSNDASSHRGNFLAVRQWVKSAHNVEIDESCKNLERLCFVSHDPAAFYNNEAIPLAPAEIKRSPIGNKVGTVGPTVVNPGRQQIAENLLGPIQWENDSTGYCQCPGAHLHTTGNGAKDCRVRLEGAPTVSCFHESCRGIVDGVNHELRSRIGKAEFVNANLANEENALTLAVTDPEKLVEWDYANKLVDAMPPIRTVGKRWHQYVDGAWCEVDRSRFRPIAQNVLPPIIRTGRREAALLEHLEGRFQVPEETFSGFYQFDEDGNVLVNAANGVVRIKQTGETLLEPHSPDHAFTRKMAAKYDPGAEAPTFDRVLKEALADELDRNLLQLCCGNFFLPDCRFEAALVAYGEAGRGKSTIAETIAGSLGKDLVARLTMSQICDPKSYHVPKLRFAAVNLGTELDAVELGDSGIFKAVVSGEPIEARPIYGLPFTMTTTCKLWFLANSLPRFKHGTEAELRRTRFLRFDYLPPIKDVTLKARLSKERDGVLRWMLTGLAELLNLAVIPMGGRESRQVHDRFKISNDPIGAFVANRCRLHQDASVAKDVIKEAFGEFCEQHNLPKQIDVWFLRSLYERWPALKEGRPRDDDGSRRRVVFGISLNL